MFDSVVYIHEEELPPLSSSTGDGTFSPDGTDTHQDGTDLGAPGWGDSGLISQPAYHVPIVDQTFTQNPHGGASPSHSLKLGQPLMKNHLEAVYPRAIVKEPTDLPLSKRRDNHAIDRSYKCQTEEAFHEDSVWPLNSLREGRLLQLFIARIAPWVSVPTRNRKQTQLMLSPLSSIAGMSISILEKLCQLSLRQVHYL